MRLHTRKFLLSSFVIVTFVLYAAFGRKGNTSFGALGGKVSDFESGIPISSENPVSSLPETPSGIQTLPADQSPPGKKISSAQVPARTSTPAPKPAPAPAQPAGSIYRDGKYTGSSANAYYGNVQVVAVIKGGKLADVQFLDYPSDRSYSAEASRYATPILRSEAIRAQSATVDTVSGATYTSEAFIESLGSALGQARI